MKNNLALVFAIISCFICSKGQSIYVYGQLDENHLDELKMLVDGIFREPTNRAVKQIKLYFLGYDKQISKKWKPSLVLVKRKRTYSSDLSNYFDEKIAAMEKIAFSTNNFKKSKDEVIAQEAKSSFFIMDRCGIIPKSKKASYTIFNKIIRGDDVDPNLVENIKVSKRSFLLSFYEPSISFLNFSLENDSLNLSSSNINVNVTSKSVILKGTIRCRNGLLKKVTLNFDNETESRIISEKASDNVSFSLKDLYLLKGKNIASLNVEYADTIVTKKIVINYLDESAVDILSPSEGINEIFTTANDNDPYFLLKIETQIVPDLLFLNFSQKTPDGSPIVVQKIKLGNLVPAKISDIRGSNDKKRYCYKISAKTEFYEFFGNAYSPCSWNTPMIVVDNSGKREGREVPNKYTFFITLENSHIVSNKIIDFIITDPGDFPGARPLFKCD